jgi:hypothetical protein
MSRRGYAHRKGRSKAGRFVKIEHYLLNCAAYRSLDTVARCLYLELKQRYTGFNNGQIALGVRTAADALGVSKNTAQRAFVALEDRGFIRVATPSSFDQKRLSREWLLTELPDDRDGTKPSKDFMRWPATLLRQADQSGR